MFALGDSDAGLPLFGRSGVKGEKKYFSLPHLMLYNTLLHQKDIEVNSYYSAPTAQQVSESINSLHENWISYVDIQKGFLRGPEELKLYDDYREKVGTMSKVVRGVCTIDSVCPTRCNSALICLSLKRGY